MCYNLQGPGHRKPVTDRQGKGQVPGLKGSEKQLNSRYPTILACLWAQHLPEDPAPSKAASPSILGECTALAVNLARVRKKLAHRGGEAIILLS